MVTKSDVQKISTQIMDLLSLITDDLHKNQGIHYNKSASQRVRVMTIEAQRLFKIYRKQSIEYANSMGPKGKLKATNVVIKKKPAEKKKAASGKPKSNRSKS